MCHVEANHTHGASLPVLLAANVGVAEEICSTDNTSGGSSVVIHDGGSSVETSAADSSRACQDDAIQDVGTPSGPIAIIHLDPKDDSLPLSPQQRRFIFAILCVQLFISQLGYTICAPFYPDEAAAKNVSSSVVGWILGSFQLVVIVVTPVALHLVPRFGTTALLNASNFIVANGTILFGLTWYVDNTILYSVLCFATRMFAASGLAVGMVLGYSLLPYLLEKDLSTAVSILESVVGFAFVAAPPIGSQLYNLGGGSENFGYVLPFLVLGMLHNLFGLYTMCSLPALPTQSPGRVQMFNFRLGAVLPCSVLVVTAAADGYFSPTLGLYLSEVPFSYSVSTVGWVFAAMSLMYVAVGPLVGMLDDRFAGYFGTLIMGMGLMLIAVGCTLMGPAPWLPFAPSIPYLWIGAVVFGAGVACGVIPTYSQLYQFALHDDEETKASAVSVMYNILFAGGSFLGPIMGGMWGERVGYATSYTHFGILCIATGAPPLCFFVVAAVVSRRSRAEDLPLPAVASQQ